MSTTNRLPANRAPRRRLARPEHIRVSLWDDAEGGTPLALHRRPMWPVGLLFAAMFAIFAAILWVQIANLDLKNVRDVFDLMFRVFGAFWILGWSVGVAILGTLTVLFLFYRESAQIAQGRLVHVPRIGPVRIIVEYDLARIRNLHTEPAGSSSVRVDFDYGAGRRGLGDSMSPAQAAQLIATIRDAAPEAVNPSAREPAASLENESPPQMVAPPRAAPVPAPAPAAVTSPAALALIAANLVPLAGVLVRDWSLADVVVLFWAESAVIGFYTLLKMAVVDRWAVLLAGPFFIGHFGGFMAVHFLFIYGLFVRGFETKGPEPGALDALAGLFVPLWPALVALLASHGVSFAANFLARREYEDQTVSALMTAPYGRIMLMQVTLILGAWLVLALKTPMPALVLLIALKIGADLRAHRRERMPKRG